MTNQLCLVLYSPFVVMALVLLFSALGAQRPRRLSGPFLLYVSSLICWLVLELLYFVLPSQRALQFVMDAKLCFVGLVAAALFLLIAGFYRQNLFFSRWFLLLLFAVPAVTAVLSFTTFWHSLITAQFSVVSTFPLTTNHIVRGTFYYLHTVYCYTIYLAIFVIVLLANRSLPRAYRSGSQFMYLALFVFLACTVIEIFGLDRRSPMDFYLLGVALSGAFFFLATYAQGSSDYQYIKKSEVFNYLDQGIFLLDGSGCIVDANLPARRLLSLLGTYQLRYVPFKEYIDDLVAKGLIQRRQPKDTQDYDLYILTSSYPVIYSVRNLPFYSSLGLLNGHIVVLSDVTNNRLFIDRLREVAGVDTLTGLPNRYSYQQLLRQLDAPEHLPLSVIAGDVNNLKVINDRYGHYEGDLLLKRVADALSDICPQQGRVCRIGGDEFMMLLPGYSKEQATELMFRIYNRLALSNDEHLRDAIALGCATKTEPGMNINALITMADRRMYDAKH